MRKSEENRPYKNYLKELKEERARSLKYQESTEQSVKKAKRNLKADLNAVRHDYLHTP